MPTGSPRPASRQPPALHPDGTWDVRRFRPTALIETTEDGWAEEAWTTIDLGEVHSDILMPTMRCSMP